MDSTRSWVVAGASFWICTFSYPMLGASGVIYVNILKTFDVTREQASWPISLTSTFYLLSGLLGGILNKYITIRTILLICCSFSGLLMSSCFFATGIWYLIIILGVFNGIAVGGIRLTSVIVTKHFLRYRAAASGINMAGLSVGGFLLSPLLQFLFDRYGFRGALLICGGISLNSVAAALLCGDPEEAKPTTETAQENGTPILIHNIRLQTPFEEAENGSLHDEFTGGFPEKANDAIDKHVKNFGKYQDSYVEFRECSYCELEQPRDGIHADGIKNGESAISASLKRCQDPGQDDAVSAEHIFAFMLKPRFYLVTLTHLAIFNNMATCLTVLVDFAVDCGFPKWNAVVLVTVYSSADFVSRLGSGWVTDRGCMSRNSWTALCLLCWTLALAAMPLGRSYYALFVCVIVSGWCNGSTLSLVPVLYVEVVHIQHYAVCFGAGSTLVGLGCLLRPLLIGYFRDHLGGYGGLFYFSSGCTFATVVFWVWLAVRSRERTKTRKTLGKFDDSPGTR
ncbi:monocarboxylate transporter 12-B-like isoform X1 [Haemaphysalis longicornis]